MQQDAVKQMKKGLFALTAIIVVGTIGYEVLDPRWDLIDSFYMTIITITTTGFKEVKPLTTSGKLFTTFLIVTGVLALAYTGGKAAQIIIEKQYFRRKRMSKFIEGIKNHYIVCGYGRMGKQICEALQYYKKPFVVIENDIQTIEDLEELNIPFIQGDSANDDILIKAGIKNASGLVAVVRSDAENVFTTLSAKELNDKLFIVSRAIEEGSESKLIKAGASRVVKPYELGGNRMVHLLLRPGVIDFIDSVARNRNLDISLEEVEISKKSKLNNLSLKDSPIRKDLNIIIVAISKSDGKFIYNPGPNELIEEGDKLIAIGEAANLFKLSEKC